MPIIAHNCIHFQLADSKLPINTKIVLFVAAYRLDAVMGFCKGPFVLLFLLVVVSCTADNSRRRSLLEFDYGICSEAQLCETTAENHVTLDKG